MLSGQFFWLNRDETFPANLDELVGEVFLSDPINIAEKLGSLWDQLIFYKAQDHTGGNQVHPEQVEAISTVLSFLFFLDRYQKRQRDDIRQDVTETLNRKIKGKN